MAGQGNGKEMTSTTVCGTATIKLFVDLLILIWCRMLPLSLSLSVPPVPCVRYVNSKTHLIPNRTLDANVREA